MRVSATLLSLALALGTASAADCYAFGGCNNCESKDSMYRARESFCNTFWSQTGVYGYGNARIILSGNGFDTQQRCWDGFVDIIESCHGTRNGGVYNWSGARFDVNFCACGKVSGGVDYELESKGNATVPVAAKDE